MDTKFHSSARVTAELYAGAFLLAGIIFPCMFLLSFQWIPALLIAIVCFGAAGAFFYWAHYLHNTLEK